jgi:Na+-translocating ferredoxin:NAD+ oxidoreductase RnfG subunit
METEVLIIILSILSTVITALIGGITYLFKSRKGQQVTKHKREAELEALKAKYHTDVERLRAALICMNNTQATVPEEIRVIMLDLLK